jgi:hypothetical protein
MTDRSSLVIVAASLALAALPSTGVVVAADPPISPGAGFIYGTVETRRGAEHTGILRWDDEEAFWDDLFHSGKSELPYADYAEDPGDDDSSPWWDKVVRKIEREVGLSMDSRVVAVRFGDLAAIRPTGDDSAVLVFRDGSELEVEGYANDVDATLHVLDAKPGSVSVRWNEIESVTFAATPPAVDPRRHRLHGTVFTDVGSFVGFVQWDSEESLSTDLLDGDVDGARVSLEMGEIRRIERRDRRSALVVLKDGRELVLSGTNDVDDDIRGIHVEDARFGRVEVPWERFERVVFDEPRGSGAAYDAYDPPTRLAGAVTSLDGERRTGRIVFDLDELWSWEMLDGSADGLDYTIPFSMVASVEPRGRTRALVTLRNGRQLELDDSHDVSDDNSGVVVIPAEGDGPVHLPWREIARIDLD